MDDIRFMFCDQVIVFDHVKRDHAGWQRTCEAGDSDEIIRQSYRDVCRTLEAATAQEQGPRENVNSKGIPADVDMGDIKSNMTKEKYLSNVEQAKEYIRAGDIFQVVLSQRFHIETEVSPLHVYRVLRTLNPSPYMYYLKMDDDIIVGTSPEALVKVDGRRLETRPIAGTRPRGAMRPKTRRWPMICRTRRNEPSI